MAGAVPIFFDDVGDIFFRRWFQWEIFEPGDNKVEEVAAEEGKFLEQSFASG